MKKILLLVALGALAAVALMSSACVLFDGVHFHSYDEWEITVRPTCTADGERERYCGCGEKQLGRLAALGHDLIVHPELPPTCTEDGLSEFTECNRCGEGDEKLVTPATGHSYSVHAAKAPTCTEIGYEEYSECENCGLSDYSELSALGHAFGEWTVTRAAACNVNGEQTRICCNDEAHTEVRETEILPHTEGEWLERAATCSVEGLRYKECGECGAVTAEEIIQPLGHALQRLEILPATCGHDGESCLKCSVCGFEEEAEPLPALGHEYDEWIVTVNPSCNSDGKRKRVCARDKSHIEYESLPKTEHIRGVEATVSPACLTDGLRYSECTICHSVIWSEVIPSLGHDFGEWEQHPASCTSEGQFRRICVRDGTHFESVIIERLPHTSGDWIVEKEPTYGDEGVRLKACSVCGRELERENIPALTPPGENEFVFVLNSDGNSYALKKYNGNDDNVEIPSSYEGKPVTAILTGAFTDSGLQTVVIPEAIEIIYENAFGSGLISALFAHTQGWQIYEGDNRLNDIPPSVIANSSYASQYLVNFADYIWKRS